MTYESHEQILRKTYALMDELAEISIQLRGRKRVVGIRKGRKEISIKSDKRKRNSSKDMTTAGAMFPTGMMPVNHGSEAGRKPTLSYRGTTL